MSPTSYQTAPPRGESKAGIIRLKPVYDNRTAFLPENNRACIMQALSDWCGKWDSNPYTRRHYPLKIACLPIPPLPQNCWLNPELEHRPEPEPEEPALQEQVHRRCSALPP